MKKQKQTKQKEKPHDLYESMEEIMHNSEVCQMVKILCTLIIGMFIYVFWGY